MKAAVVVMVVVATEGRAVTVIILTVTASPTRDKFYELYADWTPLTPATCCALHRIPANPAVSRG